MRLIDADALLDRLPKVDLDHDEQITKSGAIMDVIYLVDTAPTVEAPRWIPVTERMPEEDEMVLVVVDAKTDMITFVSAVEPAVWCPEEGWFLDAFPEAQVDRVTHWMPLPEPPEVE